MKNLIKCLEQQAWALFLVRLVLGYTFFLHGSQKVLGLFGGPGLSGFVTWTVGLGVPSWLAYLAAFFEFIGGILLFTGIVPEVGALLVIAVMIGAINLVHWKNGFFIQNSGMGFEYTLNLVLFAIASIIGGPGKYALWNPLGKLRDRF